MYPQKDGNLDTPLYTSWLAPGRTNLPLLTQGTLVPYNEIINFPLCYKNISKESLVYDCQQPQLMYDILQI